MVVDAFMFNGEVDLLEIRLNTLAPHVDYFVIGEAELTFSGHAKPLYFEQHKQRYEKFFPKIRYNVVENYYHPYGLSYMTRVMDMDNTAYPFLMAFYQKEALQEGMTECKDDDVIYYGDCDEIWTPQQVEAEPFKLEQLSYAMYLNRRSSEPWKGTAVATFAKVKQYGLNQIRMKTKATKPNGGHHFTNMGGLAELKRKIRDYDHQEVNDAKYLAHLDERYAKGEDFLGREQFKMWTDESEWPPYLTENKEKYAHLMWKTA